MAEPLLSVEAARAGILGLLPDGGVLDAEDVALEDAVGRVVATGVGPRTTAVLPVGRVVEPWDLVRLAEDGLEQVRCVRRPRVAVVANGDELVDVETVPRPGQVVDVATPALAAALESIGAEVVAVRRAADDAGDLRRAMREAAEADLVVSVAGVSMGEHDLVREVVAELGAITSWRVAMRPGKPLLVGTVLGRPLVGLPGNPVSALVGFEVFVLPAVMALSRRAGWRRPTVEAELAGPVEKPEGMRTFARARLERRGGDRPLAHPAAGQGSFQLRWLANSDVLLDLPEAGAAVPAGSVVTAILVDRAPVQPTPLPAGA